MTANPPSRDERECPHAFGNMSTRPRMCMLCNKNEDEIIAQRTEKVFRDAAERRQAAQASRPMDVENATLRERELRNLIIAEIMKLVKPEMKPLGRKATIDELEAMLNEENPPKININPDGSLDVASSFTTVGDVADAVMRVFNEARAALDKPAKADEWQPIATAPKDGTYIQVYPALAGYPLTAVWSEQFGYWRLPMSQKRVPFNPTHWCPQATPPAWSQGHNWEHAESVGAEICTHCLRVRNSTSDDRPCKGPAQLSVRTVEKE